MRVRAKMVAAMILGGGAALMAPVPAVGQVLPRNLGAVRAVGGSAATAPFGWLRSGSGFLALRTGNPSGVIVFRPTTPMATTPAIAPAAPAPALAITLPVRPFAMPDRHDDFGNGLSSCVPYARAVSGINVRGNAADWWDNAAGAYGRGHAPEPGGVLSFQSIDRMPLGHVAVVAQVLSRTMITIDHANWDEAGTIMRGVRVMDVSPNNDWTQVRVDTGGGTFGSVYPTDGFIYRHRDSGVMTAAASPPAAMGTTLVAPPPPAMPRMLALPVVHNGPSGVGAIYLGGASGVRSSIPGMWSLAPSRPRVIIASSRIGGS